MDVRIPEQWAQKKHEGVLKVEIREKKKTHRRSQLTVTEPHYVSSPVRKHGAVDASYGPG